MVIRDETLDFTLTGPETIAGHYLRRFWQPVYRSRDLQAGRAVPVTLLNEKVTLYRGESGEAHVIADRCAHRGTQLSSGWVEGDCVRCFYHGWKYDSSGQCVEQPGEDEAFKNKVRIRSYPTQEYLGLIFCYFGENEPPPLKRFYDFEREGVLEAGVPEYWPCNYFNRLDNACDPGHVAWTHRESVNRTGKLGQLAVRSISSEETEYGVRTMMKIPGQADTYLHFHMPNINQSRSRARVEGSLKDAENLWVDRLFWRIPVTDESCVSFVVDFLHLKGEEGEAYRVRRRQAEESQVVGLNEIGEQILAGKIHMRDVQDDLSIYKTFWIEDYVAQCGQGRIAPRQNDHLGRMDIGVILQRKLWQRELKALAEEQPVKEWNTPPGLADMSPMTS